MRTSKLILGLGLGLACSSPVQPDPLYPSYVLTTVDGQFLPVPWGQDGATLVDAWLRFDRDPRPRAGEIGVLNGTVRYSVRIRLPDQTVQQSIVDLDYSIQSSQLRINLCPPLALCILSTELVGIIPGPALELELTHFLGGMAEQVYRYSASLAE